MLNSIYTITVTHWFDSVAGCTGKVSENFSEEIYRTIPAANIRATSWHIKVHFRTWLPSFSLAIHSHWFWLAAVPPSWLLGNVGNDRPSDVFMSEAEPSISLQRCVKVAEVPPLCLMDGACLWTANLFYLLRQANPSGSGYNQRDPFWYSTRAPAPHLFMLNVR